MDGRSGSLILRVMRLTTPLPSARSGLGAATADLIEKGATAEDALLQNAPPWEGEGTPCGAGATTVLPPTFGSIYASETFRCLLAIYNNASTNVNQVAVHVELDNDASSLNRVLLDNRNSPRDAIAPRECSTHVVATHLPEPGMHILKCTATFIDAAQQKRTFRQFYRFNVLAPFEPAVSVLPLASRLSPDEPIGNERENVQFLVELRLLNATPAPIYIDNALLHPVTGYEVTPMVAYHSAPGGAPRGNDAADSLSDITGGLPEARRASVSAGDTQSFLFLVTRPRDETDDSNTKPATPKKLTSLVENRAAETGIRGIGRSRSSKRDSTNSGGSTRRRREIGSLSVEWRSSLGEVGNMRTASIAYEPRLKRADVELAIVAVPRAIRAQCPFAATCCIRNNTAHPVRLYLQVRRDLVGEVVPVGVSGMALNELPPGKTIECTLTLLPLRAGQHAISGVRVFDMTSKKSYNAEPPVITVL